MSKTPIITEVIGYEEIGGEVITFLDCDTPPKQPTIKSTGWFRQPEFNVKSKFFHTQELIKGKYFGYFVSLTEVELKHLKLYQIKSLLGVIIKNAKRHINYQWNKKLEETTA